MDFPTNRKTTKDPDTENYNDYLKWQAGVAERKRRQATHFNLFQSRSHDRRCSHVQYKEELEQSFESAKDAVERRLSRACSCESCEPMSSGRSGSVTSNGTTDPGSPTLTIGSLAKAPTEGTQGTPGQPPMGPSSRNSLITSPPPRSRHHKRSAKSL